MRRGPLLVGALVALIGVALFIFVMQRGADPVAAGPAPSTHASVLPGPDAAPAEAPGPTEGPGPGGEREPGQGAAPASLGPGQTAEPPVATAPPVASGIILSIPGIGLGEGLHAEGLRDGKINPAAGTVMWYTGHDRVRPGEVGTAVIAGHVVNRGRPDAFARLADVAVGDTVQLAGATGPDTYRVVRAELVDKNALTTDQQVWGANASVRRLAIVTCDDAYGFRSDGHRVANYVVIAEAAS